MTKSNYQILVIDCETGEQTFRNANADEIAQQKIEAENAEIAKVEALAKAAQRQAILDRLGLTADEAKLILG
jgi:S-adenosylmethionine:tRNA-ribosyltransferase-isomerase (queuine synthetase)